MEEERVELSFFGQKLYLKATGDRELADQALNLAKIKLKDAERRTIGAPPHQVTLVALMDLAEEYVKAKHKAFEHRAQVNEQTDRLLQLIEVEAKQ